MSKITVEVATVHHRKKPLALLYYRTSDSLLALHLNIHLPKSCVTTVTLLNSEISMNSVL
jgi:hypothetical protein